MTSQVQLKGILVVESEKEFYSLTYGENVHCQVIINRTVGIDFIKFELDERILHKYK